VEQEDLVDDDVVILDTYSSVFVWVGSHANEEERRGAMELAAQYVKEAAAADGASRTSKACLPALTRNFFILALRWPCALCL
jgi:hypothetical protein